ncbi:MAG: TonB-dependent receptor [Burkholderiaceae bacterium]
MPTHPTPVRTLSRLGLACAMAAVWPAGTAFAQDTLQSVVVTATGRQADPHETPLATELIDPGTSGAATAGAALRGEPGLSLQSDGAWGQNPVLRGLKKESVVILVDGIRVNSAQPQGAIASMLDAGLLERIEAVKGPGAVLYGSGALGGVVNLLTPEARFTANREVGGRFGITVGSADRSLSGALLLRHSDADHALLIGAAARKANDYDSPRGEEDLTGWRSDTLLAKYRHRLTDGISLRVNLQRHADHDVWYPGSARTGGQPGGAGIPPPLGTVTIHSPEQRRELASLGVDARLGTGELSAEIWRQEVFRQIRARSSTLGRDYVRNDVSFVTDGVRADYRLPLGARHLLTVGAEHWSMSASPSRYMDNNPPLFDANMRNDPFRDGRLRSTGLYAQNETEFGRTRLLAGARFDRFEGDAAQKGTGPAAQTAGLGHTDDTLSWSLGLIHPLSEVSSVYANLGRAWRAADMRERFEDAARGDGYYHIGNPQLEPERATSIELGLKGRSADVEYRLAAFRTRIDDYIAGRVTGVVHPGTGLPIKLTENLDAVTIRGFEGMARVPIGRFVGDAAFTWLRGENRQDDEPLYQMPAPELRLGIGQPADSGFHWRTQLRLVARQDRIATRFSSGTENETPGFATVDAEFGWRFGSLGGLSAAELRVHLINMLDKRYHEHLTEGISGRELPAPGRGLLVTFRGEF